jgi:signal recognition particle subunit SRP19
MGKKKGGVRVKQLGSKQPNISMMNPLDDLQIPADQMVHLPPSPDRSYKVFWPIHETFSMDTDGFQVIYPSYLDSRKTIKLGRRIGAEKAVDCPTVLDVSQGLQSMQIRHVLQPYKGYSRDISCQWENPGRVLVDVSNWKKRDLLLELASRVPTLPDRLVRVERESIERQRAEKERAEAEAAANASMAPKKAAITVAGNSKKKGKKSRKK